jgi:NAD(P)H-flavin reductase
MRHRVMEVLPHEADGWAAARIAGDERFAAARPGQFALLPVSANAILRRVFWIRTTEAAGATTLLGRATREELAHLERLPADALDGPFGHGFPAPSPQPALVLSCDEGATVADRLMAELPAAQRVSFHTPGADERGALVRFALPMNEGGARAALEASAEMTADEPPRILAAGPRAFARWLLDIAWEPEQRACALFAVTDVPMPCGIGACFGCPVEVRGTRAVCCADGPVFPLEALDVP